MSCGEKGEGRETLRNTQRKMERRRGSYAPVEGEGEKDHCKSEALANVVSAKAGK